jgi:hypothetical protein
MKKRIKITRRLIKESLDETTMPPQGVNRERTPTEKMTPEEILASSDGTVYDVPEDVRMELQQALEASKQDPTQKMRLTDRLKMWMKSLFAPTPETYTDEEADAMVDAHNKKAMEKRAQMAKPKQTFQDDGYASKLKPAILPDNEQLSMFPEEEPYEVDIKDDESLEKFMDDKEEIDPDMYRFQESMRRHFKKD